jgi:hypothetical protein
LCSAESFRPLSARCFPMPMSASVALPVLGGSLLDPPMRGRPCPRVPGFFGRSFAISIRRRSARMRSSAASVDEHS